MLLSRAAEPARGAGPWRLLLWSLDTAPLRVGAFLFTAITVLACELAVPRLLADAIDSALVERSSSGIDRAGFLIVLTVAILYVAHLVYIRLEALLGYGAMRRLRGLLCKRILEQPLDFFSRARTGELSHIVMNDTEVLQNHGVYVFSDVPFSALTILAVLAVMTSLDLRMAVVIVAFLVAASLISFRLGRPLPTLRKTIQKVAAQMTVRLSEAIGGIRTVKGYGRTDYERKRLDELGAEVTSLSMREGRLGALVEPLLELMELLGVALIVWYGAHRVLDGAMSAGVLVAFIAYMELLSEPVSRGGRNVRHIYACRGIMQRIGQFLDGLEPVRPSGHATPPGPRDVDFQSVTYRYPGSDRAAVKEISFKTGPGELIAVVGANGAGKSTLMELLLGFRVPQAGTVRVAGVDALVWDPNLWHRTVGIMPQDVFLFHASLAENIAYGRLGATAQEIEHVAMAAGMDATLKRLPDGLATIVGDRGERISGGERQRVALARLLLCDPAIVVMDEPTSAMDAKAARDIAQLLVRLSRSRTVFVIAHRPEAISVATRVLLLDDGALVFDGPPAAARSHTVYRRLYSEPEPGPESVVQLQ